MWLDKLNQMKKQSGKTTEQISIESGVPRGTLNKLFAGQTKDPGYRTLAAVVQCLGHTVDDLDPKEKSPPPENPADEDKFDALQEEIDGTLYSLLIQAGWVKPGEDLTDKQAAYLQAIIALIQAGLEEQR